MIAELGYRKANIKIEETEVKMDWGEVEMVERWYEEKKRRKSWRRTAALYLMLVGVVVASRWSGRG